MKNKALALVYLIILTVSAATTTFGQQLASSPFAELDNQLKSQGGWGRDNQRLAELFNIGRKRLGDRFEPELMKYLGQDLEKHYWISSFLEAPTYLQGAPPLPHLSLLIKQQALALLEGKEDDPPQNQVGGKISYPTWRATDIASDSSSSAPRPKTIVVSQGVLRGRAIKKAQPAYPSEARAASVSGLVKVQVLISEDGRVIEVTPLEGPEQLHEAAIEAARQWTFKPATLAGQAARMSGVLSFNFTPK